MIHTTFGVGKRSWQFTIPLVVAGCGLAWPTMSLADAPAPAPEPLSEPLQQPVAAPALAADPSPAAPVTTIILSNPTPPVIAIAPALPLAPAQAPPPRALAGPVAGALTALIPLTVGGLLWAHDDRPDLQRSGARVILAGFAAAPWVAEGASGRWGRALAFGLVSLAASTAAVIAMDRVDVFDPAIPNGGRLPFAAGLTLAFFAATAGVVDSFVMASPPAAAPGQGGDWR